MRTYGGGPADVTRTAVTADLQRSQILAQTDLRLAGQRTIPDRRVQG
jgi:hypothetical protein